MNKMNKKGFTLIEMLVVIAIIAVLVAIIVPTVSSSTVKAKAAADAANLRSVLSEATINTAANSEFDVDSLDGSVTCETNSGWTLNVTKNATTGEITVDFGGVGIEAFSAAAESGTAPTQPSAGGTT